MPEHMTVIQGASLENTDVPVFCRCHKPLNDKTMEPVTNRRRAESSWYLSKTILQVYTANIGFHLCAISTLNVF